MTTENKTNETAADQPQTADAPGRVKYPPLSIETAKIILEDFLTECECQP